MGGRGGLSITSTCPRDRSNPVKKKGASMTHQSKPPLILIYVIKEGELGINKHYCKSRWGRFAKQLSLARSCINEHREKKKKSRALAFRVFSIISSCPGANEVFINLIMSFFVASAPKKFVVKLCCCRVTLVEAKGLLFV